MRRSGKRQLGSDVGKQLQGIKGMRELVEGVHSEIERALDSGLSPRDALTKSREVWEQSFIEQENRLRRMLS